MIFFRVNHIETLLSRKGKQTELFSLWIAYISKCKKKSVNIQMKNWNFFQMKVYSRWCIEYTTFGFGEQTKRLRSWKVSVEKKINNAIRLKIAATIYLLPEAHPQNLTAIQKLNVLTALCCTCGIRQRNTQKERKKKRATKREREKRTDWERNVWITNLFATDNIFHFSTHVLNTTHVADTTLPKWIMLKHEIIFRFVSLHLNLELFTSYISIVFSIFNKYNGNGINAQLSITLRSYWKFK